MQKKALRLAVQRETLRALTTQALSQAQGARPTEACSVSCATICDPCAPTTTTAG